MYCISLWGIVRVVTKSVSIKYGDILTCPVSSRAAVDMKKLLKVSRDVVFDGAHVQRGVPGSDKGFSTNQRKFGGFLTKGGVEEQQEP